MKMGNKYGGRTDLKVTSIDVCAGVYLLWGALNMLFIAQLPIDNILFWRWGLVACVYILIRSIPRKEYILWLLVLAGIIQSAYAIGQHIGYIASNHRLFDVTGFMGNPGQLGGFQAVTFIVTFVLLKKNAHSRIAGCALLSSLLLIGYSMWLANSRAGGVAVLAGLIALYRLEVRQFLTRHKRLLWPIFIIVIGLGILVFNYRADSAKARLLIWRVSADMIADKPVAGHGVGAFNQQYMLYQADYFERNPDSQFSMVADNTAHPYNEFLHIWIELGIVGLALILSMATIAVAVPADKMMSAPLVALLVFSCFSYPSYKLGLLVLFPILFGIISSKSLFEVKYQRVLGLLILSFATTLFWSGSGYMSHRRAKDKVILLLQGRYDKDAADYVTTNFNRLQPDYRFNTQYLSIMLNHPSMMDEAKFGRIMPACENWCDIGNYYANKGWYEHAEKYYKEAASMIPTRLMPNYLLWNLYLHQGRNNEAEKMALHILNQPLKVENTFTIRAKNEVRIKLGEKF